MEASKLPEIKPEVMKEREEDKKPGFAGLLLGKLGAGGAGGAGGGLGGAGLLGALTATKAGIVGLALVGTTVASGVGVVGYKVFGPGSSDRMGGSYSLFAPRPPKAAPTEDELEGGQGARANSVSQSLQYLANANAGLAGEGEVADQAAASASAEPAADAAAAGPTVASVDANVMNNKPASLLKSDKKFGELSKVGGGGGGGGSSGASVGAGGSGTDPMLLAKAARTGQASAMAGGARANTGNARALGARRASGSAFKQLGSVHRDQIGATSSRQAGATYDGGSVGTSGIGSDAAIASGGAGADNAAASPSANPTNAKGGSDRFPAPPPTTGKNVTPWQKALDTATMLIAGAAALLFFAGKLAEGSKADFTGSTKGIVIALAVVALLMALAAIGIGAKISGGEFGQKFQGTMFILAGSLLSVTAGIMIYSAGFSDAAGNDKWDPGGWLMGIMVISGAAALGAAMAGYLTPKKTFPAGTKVPDMWQSQRHIPQSQPPDWLA